MLIINVGPMKALKNIKKNSEISVLILDNVLNLIISQKFAKMVRSTRKRSGKN